MNWQPIDSAPKDARNALVCVAGEPASTWIVYDGGVRKRIWYFKGGMRRMYMRPTHWMPLPAPPEAK